MPTATRVATSERPAVDRAEPVEEGSAAQPPAQHEQDHRPCDEADPGPRAAAHRATSSSTRATRSAVSGQPASVVRRSRAAARRSCRSASSRSQRRSDRGQRGRVVGRHQHSGSSPGGGRPERLGQPADLGRQDGDAPREGLADHHPPALRAGGQHQRVGAGVGLVEPGAGQRAGPRDPVGDAELGRMALQPRRRAPGRGRATPHRSGARAGRRPRRGPPAARRGPCRRVTAATQSSSPPDSFPSARSAGSAPGVGDVHPLGAQRVVVDHPPPAPLAGGHHGGRGHQHQALGEPGLDVALAERHVQEYDEPQPLGLGEHGLGRPDRDETVHQHDRVVGQSQDWPGHESGHRPGCR